MAIREGKWKCPGCETVNRGRDVNCTSCGKARENVEFFLDEDEGEEVQDAQVLAQANAGADWLCAYCEQSNKAALKECGSCGAPRTEGKERKSGDVVGLGYKSASEQKKAEAAAAAMPAAAAPAASSGAGIFGKIVAAGCLAALLLCCVSWFFLHHKRAATLSVASVSWKCTIEVQRWDTVQHSDWSVPPGGRVVSHSEEVKSYRDVQTGTRTVTKTRQVQTGTKRVKVGKKDKGNGFFEDVYEDRPVYSDQQYTEQEPVYTKQPIYATKYKYEIEEWVFDHDHRSSGTFTEAGANVTPRWPEVSLKSIGASGKKTQEGRRTGVFEVKLVEEQQVYIYKPTSESELVKFKPGSSWKGKVSRAGEVAELVPADLPAEASGGR